MYKYITHNMHMHVCIYILGMLVSVHIIILCMVTQRLFHGKLT